MPSPSRNQPVTRAFAPPTPSDRPAPARGERRIRGINPVAKLAASAVIALGLVVTIDWVSASIALGLEAVLLIWSGLSFRRIVARVVPLTLSAALAASTILLYGRPSGATHLEVLAIHITDGSIELMVATFLRVLAMALPAVVLFGTTEATEMADGLGQVLKLPPRFVIGALAAWRLVSLVQQDWQFLTLSRRARGVGDGRGVRRFGGQAFALLVLSIRRGTALATAMEARGFGGRSHRSWARPSRLRWADATLVFIALVLVGVALTASVATGHFTPILAQ